MLAALLLASLACTPTIPGATSAPATVAPATLAPPPPASAEATGGKEGTSAGGEQTGGEQTAGKEGASAGGEQPGGEIVGGESTGGSSGGNVTLTVVNSSASTVCYMRISPTTSSVWGDDWLGADTISIGASYNFTVPSGSYDLRAEFCGGGQLVQWSVSLASNMTWTLTGGGSSGGGGTASLTVYNNTSTTLCYMYISPTTSSSWGNDQLGSSTIPAGGSHTFSVPAGSYDLKAEDCSHNTLSTQMGVYISGSTSWTVSGGGGGGGSASLTVYNNTSTTLCYMYISPTTSSSWGNDQLGSSTISAGGSHTFSVPAGSYDLKAEDCSHNTLSTQMGVYISGSTSWTVSGGGGGGGSASLTVYNNTSSTLFYMYISPSTSSSWGDDQLGSSTIPAGGSYTFSVPAGTYDLKAEDSSHNVLGTQMGVYISGSTSWTVSGGGGGGGSASLTVYNNSSTTLCYMYISPTTSSSWGDDQLGSSTIPAGGSHTFSVPAGSYDLKAENCSHTVLDTQMGVYISGSTSWSVP
jgi:hypothetical protein